MRLGRRLSRRRAFRRILRRANQLGARASLRRGIARHCLVLGRGTGRGFLLHSALVVDPHDEWVVGLAGQVLFHRRPAPKGETAAQKRRRDRESAVWGQLIEQVGPPPVTAQWVHVMDRGADDFEVYCRQ